MIDFVTPQVKPEAGLLAVLATPPCTADSTDLACKLARYLPVLYVVAAVLGIALIVVIGIAAHAWRKNNDVMLERGPDGSQQ